MKSYAVAALIFLLSLLFLSGGCTAPALDSDADEPGTIKVVATIFPLAEIIENIGGDAVSVTELLRPGDSPHTFEPTVEQARIVARADILFYIGGGLDDWAVRLAAGEGIPAVNLMEHLQGWILDYGPLHPGEGDNHYDCDEHEHSHGPQDPHVWTDPILVCEALAPLVAEKLAELAPRQQDAIAANLARYQESLQELHQEIAVLVEGFSNRRYISYHSAWNYFGNRYGLEEAAAVEEFPGQEPSARWLIDLVRLAAEHQIDVIFAEPQLSPKAAEVIAREIGGRVLLLDPLGGRDIPGRDSYLNLMRYNAGIFKEALE